MTNYRVWAPYAAEAELVLGSKDEPKYIPMSADPAAPGWFEADRERSTGERYAFRLRATDGHGAPEDNDANTPGDWTIPLPDPRSQRQPDGPHGFSEVVDLASYDWTDGDWTGRILPGGLIYEMHVGTFSASGDFTGVEEHLDHLVDLGVTHLEIMPINPFGGDRNWGYDGVGWHAVHEGYGGPAGLQRLVDACHRRGLAVVLDVVYNHFGPDGNYVGFFGPYTSGGNTGWGEVVNLTGDDSDEVRAYILDAVRQWFVDYHIDGLRLDAVHALHDEGAFHILEQMQVLADTIAARTGIPRTLIAESDQNDPRLTRARAAGGFGLAAQWDDDVHHALHTLVSGEDHAYYADFGTVDVLAETLTRAFWHAGRMSTFRGRHHGRQLDTSVTPLSSFVTYTTTHDQTGNRAIGDRPSMNLTPAQQALKAAVIACSPFTPMLFQGEEWGASTPFAFFCSHESDLLQRLTREGRMREFARSGWNPDEVADPSAVETFDGSKLKWDERADADHARLLDAYRALFGLRKTRTVLRDPWAASVETDIDPDGRWLTLTRTTPVESGADDRVVLVANFSDSPVTVPGAGDLELLHTYDDAPAALGDGVIDLPAWGYAILG
ncbi:malto-oligosyltrehalose trehalohydrolase [Corynebacterium sp. TAE3-ERU12]|uniref:malto-oligosyltrehalose trehalohydrolase n=1 Tax=Corynebacterium sp. TAE3-ERU12 TaxID=2849491 RepID=UPI001C451DE6|nr:malto-oligosyltrehalose trehalohydrolase [Corynebacterium sp. TAE3-ERU12]MBV7296197.1 malto-oligosyltrehalose trehalohydrolase [Corynebacterium sp. TAE3-ERU12]